MDQDLCTLHGHQLGYLNDVFPIFLFLREEILLRRKVHFSAYKSLEVLMKCRLREKSFLEIVFEEELVEKFITKLLNVITVAVETQSRLVVVRGGRGLMGQW